MMKSKYSIAALGLLLVMFAGCGDKQLDSRTAFTPLITGISPNRGPSAGGTIVTIEGRLLCDDPAVRFDDVDATLIAGSTELISVTSPPHAIGTAKISVSCEGLSVESVEGTAAFDYHATDMLLQTEILHPQIPDDAAPLFHDVDADGRDDLVLVQYDEARSVGIISIHRYRPQHLGFETRPVFQVSLTRGVPFFPVPFWIGNLDADPKDLELMALTASAATDTIHGSVYKLGDLSSIEPGSGTEEPEAIGSFSLPLVSVLALTDINGDALPDLITAGNSGTHWLAGDGASGFAAAQRLLDEPASYAFGHGAFYNPRSGARRVDLDRDKITDLILFTADTHHVFFGARDGAFRHEQYPSSGYLVYFDDDDLPDHVQWGVASDGTCWIDVSLATGAAEYQPTALRHVTPCGLRFSSLPFNLGDTTSPQFVVATAQTPHFGAFTIADELVAYQLHPAPPRSTTINDGKGRVSLARVEEDERLTLMVSARGALRALYLEEDFSDELTARRLPPLSRGAGTIGCAGDFTGDGVADLMLIPGDTFPPPPHQPLATLLTGPAPFKETRLSLSTAPARNCRTGHFNDDAHLDFVAGEAVYLNDGTGRNFSSTELAVPEYLMSKPEVVIDLDGDGVDEIVFDNGEEAVVFSKSALVDRAAYDQRIYPRVFGDLNSDGLLDLVGIGDYGDGPKIRVFRGEKQAGSWTLEPSLVMGHEVIPELTDKTTLTIVDMNADDTPDLVVTVGGAELPLSAASYHYVLLQWEGDRFRLGGRLQDFGARVEETCDLDGNGLSDLVLSSAEGTIGWSQQDGEGKLSQVRWADFGDAGQWRPQPFGCADFTGDGLADVVLIDQATLLPYLLVNRSR